MLQRFSAENIVDEEGRPAGGHVQAVGLQIDWQAGPLGKGKGRKEPNGAFVETVLQAAKQRLEWYQQVDDERFRCPENSAAISKIGSALSYLDERTAEREARGVEGTHER